jgi:hypothetical protein
MVERFVRLWTEPVPASAEALAVFSETYTDPVSINGVEVPLAHVVARACGMQRALILDHDAENSADGPTARCPATCQVVVVRVGPSVSSNARA